MPVITIEGGPVDTAVKKQLIEQLTEKAAEITGAPKQFFTVLVRELPLENIGLAGETVPDMKARMAREAGQ